MGLKLYAHPFSTCGRRVIVVLHEKNVDFELITIDLAKGEQKSPEHMARQPFGKLPVLEDDGFMVYESRAICKYIAKKYAGQGTKLIPDDGDLKSYGLFEQACSIEQSYFDPPASAITIEKVFKKMRGMEVDEDNVAKQVAELDATAAVYEQILSKQSYLAGNELTLADLFHLPYGWGVRESGYESIFTKYPAVHKWVGTLSARESWRKTIA